MAIGIQPVGIKQLPETLNKRQKRLFFRELKSSMSIDRPSIVFDCSRIRRLDRSDVLHLLCCLEEALKRNGDIKLAAVPARARAILELNRADRVFEIFDSNADAANSFHQVPAGPLLQPFVAESSHRVSQNAGLPH
jgi:anti-anti-sigma regulatory factor